jgi:hypothetical protein
VFYGRAAGMLAVFRLPGSLRNPPLHALYSGALAYRSVGHLCFGGLPVRVPGAEHLCSAALDVLTHPSGGPLFGLIVISAPGVHLPRGCALRCVAQPPSCASSSPTNAGLDTLTNDNYYETPKYILRNCCAPLGKVLLACCKRGSRDG